MSTGMYKSFETDTNAEVQGIWLEYPTFSIRIARAGGSNKKFQKQMENKTRPHRRSIQTETFENEQAVKLMQAVYADSIVLDWKVKKEDGAEEQGIEAKDGSIVPFNRVNVLTAFTDLPDLFVDVQTQAVQSALFRKQLLEEAGKN